MIHRTIHFLRRAIGTEKLLRHQQIFLGKLESIENVQREVLMAQIFNNTIHESPWLKWKNFSPTEWSLNYNALYYLYKILDLTHPLSILEFGLGQSSKMIYQYTLFHPGTTVLTYEHDEKWIEFFEKQAAPFFERENLFLSKLEEIIINGKKTLSYKNNCEELKDRKFDLILVDGPFGQEHYSRPQILNIIPACIKRENFIIMIDDVERVGEQETIMALLDIFKINGIDCIYNTYSTTKSFCIICSPNLRYITTV